MDKKEKFIDLIEEVFRKIDIDTFVEGSPDAQEGLEFWEAFKSGKTIGGMTENGGKILQYMQENEQIQNNLFKSKEIGEGLFMSSRSVSGAMRKLITDGYVSKMGSNPVVYSLTDSGRAASI